jgi:hypothetical protein
MKVPESLRKRAALIAALLLAATLIGCKPVTLKTLELQPGKMHQAQTGSGGSFGFCLSQGDPPQSSFSPGKGQVVVGFDNFLKPGSGPFPCNDVRATVFRGDVPFDVSMFDSIVTADLLFDAQGSVTRSGGEATGTSPPTSHATTLGLATSPLTGQQLFDNDVTMPAGPSFNMGVSSQVRQWIEGRTNLGFVLAGPTGLVDSSNFPKNNDAKVTWYGNFRLRIAYDPAQNPKAPQ